MVKALIFPFYCRNALLLIQSIHQLLKAGFKLARVSKAIKWII
jgi:hypothetical protein